MFPIGLVLQGIGTIAWPLLQKVLKINPDYNGVIDAAVKGVPSAIDSVQRLIKWSNDGHDPTADEIRNELRISEALHDAIQATGNSQPGTP